MSKGKRAKKNKKVKLFWPILVIFIIIMIIILYMKISKNKLENNNNDNNNDNIVISENNENAPIISYYDKTEGRKIEIKDKQVYNKKISVLYSKGSARISEDGKNFREYTDETLSDGTYTILVEAEDGGSAKRVFTIDTLAPKILGVEQDTYDSKKTIEFENPDDVKIATLAKEDGETIDLKAKLNKKGSKYTVEESGIYKLYAEDHNGNGITINFVIILL